MRQRASRGRQYAITKPDSRPRHPVSCPWCVGTGYAYVTKSGHPVEWREAVDQVHLLDVVRCTDEMLQPRIKYRDFTEPRTDD